MSCLFIIKTFFAVFSFQQNLSLDLLLELMSYEIICTCTDVKPAIKSWTLISIIFTEHNRHLTVSFVLLIYWFCTIIIVIMNFKMEIVTILLQKFMRKKCCMIQYSKKWQWRNHLFYKRNALKGRRLLFIHLTKVSGILKKINKTDLVM